ncbi:hypothetical protein BDZ45DRAFT_799118 [Acephala macrosclerotiorum]|nr:hypothetical protein BDZ45DRAFT_799118 [Acephala macrosclerotiorum]
MDPKVPRTTVKDDDIGRNCVEAFTRMCIFFGTHFPKLRSELRHTAKHDEEVKKLNKKIATKYRSLAEKGKVFTLAREPNHKHQEELKSEATRVKLEAENPRHELERARKELKQIAGLQLWLDAQKASTKSVENLVKKNEGLQKSLAVAKTNQRIETDRINSAVQKATAPLTEKVNWLEQLRDADAKKIEELPRFNEAKATKILERGRAKKKVKGRSEADFAALEKELAAAFTAAAARKTM